MNDDIKLIAGLDINESQNKIDDDIKKLKISDVTIKTLLSITDDVIKKHLDDIQKIVNTHKPIKIKTELDSKSIDLSNAQNESKKLKEIYSSMAKEIRDKISDAFGITNKKTLGEIENLSSDWLKMSNSINKNQIEESIFEKVYNTIKKLSSIINETQDTYKNFVEYVNKSKINMQPFGSDYEDARKLFGIGNISSKSGLPMDVWYQEAREQFPQILPAADNVEDQFSRLLEALKEGRDRLKENKITDEEIKSYFGGEDGIKSAIFEILGQISAAYQDINNTKIESPKIDSVGIEDIEKNINIIEDKLEGLNNSNKKISFDFDDADVVKTVKTIDSTTGETIKKVTSLNEGIGKTRQVFETVSEVTGELETSIEKVTDIQSKSIEKLKGDQAAASNKQYWKDEEERIKSFSNTLKTSMEEQARFEKKFGKQVVAGINFDNSESEIRKAIQVMNGFEEANTRALRSVQDGTTVLQQYAVSVGATDGNFKNYVLSIDEATNKHYLLEKGISAVDTAAARLGEQTKFITKFGKELEGIKLPTDVGELDLSDAIRKIEGFENSYVKTIGSVKHGNHELQQAFVVTENAAGGFDTFKISIDQVTGSTHILEKGLRSTNIATSNTVDIVNALAGALVAMGIKKTIAEITDMIWTVTESSIAFESLMANVKKTGDLTIDNLKKMKEEFFLLSSQIPISLNEIAVIAEKAGQINISDISRFTKTISDLTASTDLAHDSAAVMIAQFKNITNLPEEQIKNLSSSLVMLGNNTAGTESAIMSMSLALSSAGSQAGMTASDILGLSAGLVSTGISAQSGGSSFSRAINRISLSVAAGADDLKEFASIANLSVDDFVKAWTTAPSQAMIMFIEGLGQVERHGKSAQQLLNDLGMTELKLSDALRRASSSGNLFRDSLKMANEAFVENTALVKESQIKYETVASKMQIMENSAAQLKITLGDELSPVFDNLLDTGIDLTQWATDFMKENTILVAGFTSLAAATGVMTGTIAAAAAGKAVLTAASKALGLAVTGSTLSIRTFSAALMATPLAPVIIALGAVTAAATALSFVVSKNKKENEESIKISIEKGEALEAETEALENQKNKVIELRQALASANLTQSDAAMKRSELMDIQEKLIAKYKSESNEIDLLGDSVDSLSKKYDNLITSAAKSYLTDNAHSINKAKEYLDEKHNPNENFGISAGTKVFFSNDAEDQMDKEVQEFMKSLSESLGGKYGFSKKWDWDQWVFGGTSTELRFDNVTTDQYLDGLRDFSDKVKEYGYQTGKDVSKILGDVSQEITKWDSNKYRQQLAIINQATEAEVISTYSSQYKSILDAQEAFNKAYISGDKARTDEELRNIISARDEAIAAVGNDNHLQDYFNKMIENQESAIKRLSIKDDINENLSITNPLKGLLNDTSITDWSAKQQNSFNKLRNILNLTAEKDVPELISALTEMEILEEPTNAATRYKKELSDLTSIISETQKAYAIIISAAKDSIEDGGISTDTIAMMAEITDGYLDYLYIEEDQLKLNIEKWKELSDEKLKSEISEIKFKNDYLEQENAEIEKTIQNYIELQAAYPDNTSYRDKIFKLDASISDNNAEIKNNQLLLGQYNAIYDGVQKSVDLAKYSIEKLNSELDNIQSAYQTVSKAVEEYRTTNQLSIDSYQELLSLKPQYLSMLLDEHGNLTLNKEALEAVTAARINELAQKQAELLIDNVLSYKTEADALTHLKLNIDEVTGSLINLNAQKLNQIQLNLGDDIYKEIVSQLNAIEKARDSALAGITSGGLSGGSISSELTNAISSLQSIHDMLKDVKEEMKDFGGKISIDNLNKIIKAYPQLESAVARYNAGLITSTELYNELSKYYEIDKKNYINILNEKLSKDTEFYKKVLSGNKELSDKLAQVYGGDFQNWTTINELKLGAEAALIATLEGLWGDYYKYIKKDEEGLYEFNNPNENIEKHYNRDPGRPALINRNTYLNDGYNRDYIENKKTAIDAINNYNEIMKSLAVELESSLNFNFDKILFDTNTADTAKSTKSEFEKTFDWIETRLERLSSITDSWKKKMETAVSLSGKNNAVDNAVKSMKSELTALNKAYDEYTKEAESIGLSEAYIDKITKGDYSIEKLIGEADEKTAEKIQDYIAVFDKLSNVEDRIFNIKSEIESLPWQKIENATADFEDKFNRVSSITEEWKQKLESAVTLKEQNKSIDNIIASLSTEIDVYKQAGDFYREQADLLKLDKNIKKQIDSGAYNIDLIKSKAGKKDLKLIDDYVRLVDLEKEMQNDINKLLVEQKNLPWQKIENISADYDKRIEQRNNEIERLKTEIALSEAMGETVDADKYISMRSNENDIKAFYQSKKDAVKAEFEALKAAGNISVDRWLYYTGIIADIETELINCDIAIQDINDSIRNLKWQPFEDAINKIKTLKDELSSTRSLLVGSNYDESGNLTNTGITNSALILQEMDANKDLIEANKLAMTELNDELRQGIISQNDYNEKSAELQASQLNVSSSIKSLRDSLISLKKEGIQAVTDAFTDNINQAKEALKAQKELNDYASTMEEKQKKLAILQKQITTLSLSADRADIAERLKLEKEASDLQKDINKTTADNEYDIKMKVLDEELEAFQNNQDAQIKELETSLDAQERMINDFMNDVKNNYSNVYREINTTADTYSLELSDTLKSPWTEASKAAELYKSIVEGINAPDFKFTNIPLADPTVGGTVKPSTETAAKSTGNDYISKREAISSAIKYTGDTSVKSETALNQYVIEKGFKKLTWDEMAELGQDLGFTDSTVSKVKENGSLRMQILEALKNAGFSRGGNISLGKIIKGNGDDVIMTAKVGEEVLTDDKVKAISDAADKLQKIDLNNKIDKSKLVRIDGYNLLGTSKEKFEAAIMPAFNHNMMNDIKKSFTGNNALNDNVSNVKNGGNTYEVNIDIHKILDVNGNIDENLAYKLKHDWTLRRQVTEIISDEFMSKVRNLS